MNDSPLLSRRAALAAFAAAVLAPAASACGDPPPVPTLDRWRTPEQVVEMGVVALVTRDRPATLYLPVRHADDRWELPTRHDRVRVDVQGLVAHPRFPNVRAVKVVLRALEAGDGTLELRYRPARGRPLRADLSLEVWGA